jgi:hypothetical protein
MYTNKQTDNLNSLVFKAFEMECKNMIEFYTGHELNVVDFEKNNSTPLLLYIENGKNNDLLEKLLDKTSKLLNKTLYIYFEVSPTKKLNENFITKLINKGASANYTDDELRLNPLLLSIIERDDNIIKLLLNTTTNEEILNDALLLSIEEKRSDDIIKLLLDKTTNNTTNEKILQKALLLFCKGCKYELIEKLIGKGVVPNYVDKEKKKTPLLWVLNRCRKKWEKVGKDNILLKSEISSLLEKTCINIPETIKFIQKQNETEETIDKDIITELENKIETQQPCSIMG